MRKIKYISVLFGLIAFLASCNKSAAAEFNGKKVVVTVDNVAEKIAELTEDTMLIVSGRFRSGDMRAISSALKVLENRYSNTFDDSVDSAKVMVFLNLKKTEGLNKIEEELFKDSGILAGIILPGSVTKIEQYAFENCQNLKKIEIPVSVTEIEYGAFNDCSKLTELILPSSVTKFDSQNFESLSNLKKLTISDIAVLDSDFSESESLSEINIIKGSEKFISDELESIYSKDGVLYAYGKNENEGQNILVYYPRGRVDKFFTVPNGITTLMGKAFCGCTNLEKIELPKTLTSIQEEVFIDCENLKYIKIPKRVSIIGEAAFWGCDSLESIEIPDSVTDIGKQAFWRSGLKSIKLSANLEKIPMQCFTLCENLISVDIPADSVISVIEEDAFFGCKSLKYIELPEHIKAIEGSAFSNCVSLESIKLSKSLVEICESSFYGCSCLKSIEIPDAVLDIGDGIFEDCSSLESIKLSENIKRIPSKAFYNCRALVSVKLPEYVKIIENSAFENCIALKAVGQGAVTDLGLSVIEAKEIGREAFAYCKSLVNVNLVDGIESIGRGAFYACESLNSFRSPFHPKRILSDGSSLGDLIFGDGWWPKEIMGPFGFPIETPEGKSRNRINNF